MKVDLSPDSVSALHDVQANADNYIGMIDCACDYIIESADTLSEEFNSAAAMGNLKNLRDLRKVISMFAEKGDAI